MTLRDKIDKKLNSLVFNEEQDLFDFVIRHRFRKYFVAARVISSYEIHTVVLDDEGNGVIFYD